MKPILTLIVIANDGKARLVQAGGPGTKLAEIGHLTADPITPPEDDKGRGHSSYGHGTPAMEPRTSAERLGRAAFARRITEAAEAAWEAEEFGRLIVTAAPAMLGALRETLTARLDKALVAEMDKDLVKTPLAELGSHFESHIVV